MQTSTFRFCAMALATTGVALQAAVPVGTQDQIPSSEITAMSATVSAQTTVTGGPGYTRVDGEVRGGFFILVRPDGWNGDLVMLLGGAVSAGDPVSPPEPLFPLAEALAAQGFGVAMSSYRSNGFAVADGIIDSRIAELQFTSHFGRPIDTFLWGVSMGTHILQHYLERQPGQYAGGLSVCGSLGGGTLAWTTFVHKRAIFDYFFPGVLPGDALSTPTSTRSRFIAEVVPRIAGAILADLPRAIDMTGVEQFHYTFTGDVAELIDAVVLSVAIATLDGADLVEKAHGIPVDTTTTVYSGSSDDAALNAGIDRFTADPNAASYLGATDPDGRLIRPILEIHNRVDPIVPLDLHREAYGALLAQRGNSDFVWFREVDRYGHCEVTPEELFQAFGDLILWAKAGVQPIRVASQRVRGLTQKVRGPS
jgi:pimeloyl-ACP methyl ester carboxylesterase